MSAHIFDELPRMLTGEASREVVLDAAAHLRTCADCQQELVSAVVAHASLTSAQRFAPSVLARDSATGAHAAVPGQPLPQLAELFDQVRSESTSAPARLRNRRALIAVAAAVVVAGGGAAAGVALSGSNGPASRNVALEATRPGAPSATATLTSSDHMHIDATSLPQLDARHQYEVWLTNGARSVPQSVGFIGADRKADITVPANLMGQYRDIAVSVQGVHQIRYSGTTVLLGTYE